MSTEIQLSEVPSIHLALHYDDQLGTDVGTTSLDPGSEGLNALTETPTELPQAATLPGTEADTQLNVRPPFFRVDSTQTVVVHSNDIGKGIKSRVAVSAIGESGGESPASHDDEAIHSLEMSGNLFEETKAMRRLRMGSSFVTLFLAGWKWVSFFSLHDFETYVLPVHPVEAPLERCFRISKRTSTSHMLKYLSCSFAPFSATSSPLRPPVPLLAKSDLDTLCSSPLWLS